MEIPKQLDEVMRKFGEALEGAKSSICIHEEFRHDCPKCLRQEIRQLRKALTGNSEN